ncbi:uncharacterized protein BX663DRAFT_494667 [Cokeromyces recurvatus]|uniref:uncharacterized protein n=1 Tax=Cokeromyces recurvatus TaxID=90255 RepID=UPI00221FACD9|nr:uncharacterized protein BX663DRAFT_494667 [Cokeromyces recurvatus]KAI7907055.1 hypothetical protein BX663DRAFT_494667 [Cokeromyces recurvatus]
MVSTQVAGFTVLKDTPLNLNLEEAIMNSKKSGSFLLHMLIMIDPEQIKTNEIAKDAYEECLQLKEYLSEQLWSVVDTECIASVQSALDELTLALNKYEMINDMIDGEWEFIESSNCHHNSITTF